ncbi:MAG: cobalt-precorrin-5B (C(1))-methyltransferase CbiD [Clostridiales bacterium]|jgi:cobalt-precorrin-5B (C1)-methyltransferase|nr:cobalt-precorrin-5B (C(1))-methyltransferase CbiD [Clostridiales bacterium]
MEEKEEKPQNLDYNNYSFVEGKYLRRGYTTGTCAAAAAKAAATMLFSGDTVSQVVIKTPKGPILTLDVENIEILPDKISCAVKKDGGDDPDITNGLYIYAMLSKTITGIEITGGEGIGLVTKPGLDQPVGAYAINTVPRKCIAEACAGVCDKYGYTGGLRVQISAPGGKQLAKRTFNPRLGIVGGLSILGTSGIVEPMSTNAVVDTIRAELNMLYSLGKRDILLTVGNYGEAFAHNRLGLSMAANVKCSNFIGETLNIAAEKGFKRVLLIGHLGKLVKLSLGITNTHSSNGDGRLEAIVMCALKSGADLSLLHKLSECVNTDGAFDILKENNLLNKTMDLISSRIDDTLKRHTSDHLEVGFICFSGTGENAEICAKNALADNMREVFYE